MSATSGSEPAAPRDAATVLLLRDGEERLEVFMVRRHGKSGFMAGAYVFPGGKVDEADASDRLLERVSGRAPEDAAAALGEDDARQAVGLFIAAARETFEEAGVLLADVPGGASDADREAQRKALRDGKPLADALDALDATLRLDRLVPHSRWVTPEVEPRRYDTRFFLAHAPGHQVAAHDRHETTAGEWITPERALARGRTGEIQLPPPTLRTLELLATHGRVEQALDAAAGHPPPLVEPVVRDLGGTLAICLPGDPEHPEDATVVDGATRIVRGEGRWWSRDAD